MNDFAQNYNRELTILYEDEDLLVVSKPSGLLVHRSRIDKGESWTLIAAIREMLEREVYPIHRLDKPTSGAIICGKNSSIVSQFSKMQEEHPFEKTYVAIVRGHLTGSGVIDYPLKREAQPGKSSGIKQEAVTEFRGVGIAEVDKPIGKYPTARFSLVELTPRTGRTHQLRRHMAHLRRPIIGDTRHGDGAQNRFAREHLGCNRLCLHASSVRFQHPKSRAEISAKAPLQEDLRRVFEVCGFR